MMKGLPRRSLSSYLVVCPPGEDYVGTYTTKGDWNIAVLILAANRKSKRVQIKPLHFSGSPIWVDADRITNIHRMERTS